jgi:L-lactate dehydrogenase complex protein LldG
MSSRETILARVRAALADVPADERPQDVPAPRDHRPTHTPDDPAALLDLLHTNLADYRARVHRTGPDLLPALIAGLPAAWLAGTEVEQVHESADMTPHQLEAVDSVVTGCTLAIAETGTVVLDAGPGRGRRILTLVPDHHICVVHSPRQVLASLPQAMPRLGPARPQTWISGPSATSDIELDRVEGVDGPRTLDVILVTGSRLSG